MTFRIALLMLLAALALPGAARAQVESREGITLQNQIQELKRDIQALRDSVNRGAAGSSALGGPRPSASSPSGANGDVATALLERVARLEDDIRQLRGRIDETANTQQRMGEDLAKQIDDLNFKLGAKADPVAPTTPPATPPKPAMPPIPPATPAAKRTAEAALQEGNAALARRDYPTAETAAREVIATPKSPRAYDAQVLLAQALTGKKDYQGAAVAYDDTYNRSRTGTKAQDSLLGLANSLNAIGEKRAACATLDKLKAEFAAPRADLKDSIAGARQRAACH
jgi:TolA-binding protein